MQINTPSTSSDTQYVNIQGLGIGYATHHKRHVVAEELEARAPGGTLTCLIGRNGSGKSTLLRTVARLQPKLGGRVELGGQDAEFFTASQFARTLGVVLTSRPDASNITVGEVVALGRAPYTGFWGRLSQSDHDIVNEAMRSVGIEQMSRRRVCSLSDGECQKTMIAKTLAQQTPYILLDEPTAFLDFPGKVELMLLLRRLAHEHGKTILMSTHDLEAALRTADRLWLLTDGALKQGTPQELADSGAIERYIGRPDVTLNHRTLEISINTDNYNKYIIMENNFMQIIKTRRSCRHYRDEQVDDQLLNTVLEAGTYAPTGHGTQDPQIVAVQNPALKQRLAALNAKIMGVDSNPYYDAPTYLLVFASKDNPNAFQDGSCVLENMMLAAHAVGLSTCWINREYQMFQTDEGRQLMEEMGIAADRIGIGALSLGYPSRELREAKPRKEDWIKVIK